MTRKISRRGLIKGAGAATAAGVGLGYQGGVARRGQAIDPTILGAAPTGTVLDWALGAFDAFSADQPDDGLTASSLKQDVYQTARTRKSTNASTFVDNRNLIQSGLENTLYVDGKVAALEKLNEEAAKADVQQAALNAVDKYASTIEKNFLKSWNESVNELYNQVSALQDHPDTVVPDVIDVHDDYQSPTNLLAQSTNDVNLSDGSTMTLQRYGTDHDGSTSAYYMEPVNGDSGRDDFAIIISDPSSTDTWHYLDWDWITMWDELQTTITNVESGLQTWVTNTYDQVQAGEIDTSELTTPRDRAKMMSEDGAKAKAIADLAALNIPVTSGIKMTIRQTSTGSTIRGRLALTNDSQTIEAGGTYNPSADTFTGDAYFIYDVAEGSGTWEAFEEGIDGGVITITEEPYQKTMYDFATSKNETVTVDSGNFTPTDGNGTKVDPQNATAWEADVSDRLENDIANIEEADFFASSSESQIKTVQLRDEFVVKEIVNLETNETQDSAEFTNSEPQNDENYITKQEWEDLQEQNERLIELYEESQKTSGSGFDLSGFSFGNVPGVAVAGAAIVGGIAFIGALFK